MTEPTIEVIAHPVRTYYVVCPVCSDETEFNSWKIGPDATLTCTCGNKLKVVDYG